MYEYDIYTYMNMIYMNMVYIYEYDIYGIYTAINTIHICIVRSDL